MPKHSCESRHWYPLSRAAHASSPRGGAKGEPPIYLHSRKSVGIIAHFPLFFYRQKKITSADKLGIDFFSPVCYNSPNAGLVHR